MNQRLPSAILLLLCIPALALADDASIEFGGHTKFRLLGQRFGGESLYSDVAGQTALDAGGELRLNVGAERGRWAVQSDYQLLALYSEFLPAGLPDDGGRLFDFTHVLAEGGETAAAHRLDRFWVGYTGERTVVRLGRQALSWGNGLFFSPLDLVNPFDPTAVDTEYKAGDDMLYLQSLRGNGDDVQAAVVWRRDPATGDVDRDLATAAVKYHGFRGDDEYDVLLAEHRGARVLGLGAVHGVGGAIVRGDLAVTNRDGETNLAGLVNLSYSWVFRERNVSAAAEYYFDGDDGHYVAGSLMVEMSPLWILTPTLVARADDPSALFQLVTQYSLSDDLAFLGSLNLPLGPSGTAFGGPESGIPNRYLSYDAAVFAQLAWYF
jgi:hypothetical protein